MATKRSPQRVNAPLTPDLTEARRLFEAGLHLVPLIPETKQPPGLRWNSPENAVTRIDDRATGYGFPLAANKRCSIDPDNVEPARIGLAAVGFDLDALMAAGVRTISTRPGSGGRSTFRDPGGLTWIKFSTKEHGTILELRAHSDNLQDVVPGLIYRDKAGELRTQSYANGRCLDDALELPPEFLAWWRRASSDAEFLRGEQQKVYEALGVKGHLSISAGGSLAFPSEMRSPFNETVAVEDILERNGYVEKARGRWEPPTASGAPGVRPVPKREGLWHSDHASDPLFGTFDAWTAFVALEHDGDVRAAESAFRAEYPDKALTLAEALNRGRQGKKERPAKAPEKAQATRKPAPAPEAPPEAAPAAPEGDAELVEKYRDHPTQPRFGDGKKMEVGSPYWLAHFRREEEAQAAASAPVGSTLWMDKHPLLPTMPSDFLSPRPPMPRPVVEHWLPRQVVTLFGAHGGEGKSFVALEVAVRIALGLSVFGCKTEQTPVLVYSCEDSEAVMRDRADRLAEHFGFRPADLDGRLHLYDMTAEEQVELFTSGKAGAAATELAAKLHNTMRLFQCGALIVDNASDVFAGNENARAEVRQFMRLQMSDARRGDYATLLLAHVNKVTAGMSAGENTQGYSGSTAWHNSARSRWFMAPDADNSDLRVLTLEKANYGRRNLSVEVKWHEDKKLLLTGAAAHREALGNLTGVMLAKIIEYAEKGIEMIASMKGTGSLQGALRKDVPQLKGYKATAVQDELEKLYRDGYLTKGDRCTKNSNNGRKVTVFVPTDKARETLAQAARMRAKIGGGPRTGGEE